MRRILLLFQISSAQFQIPLSQRVDQYCRRAFVPAILNPRRLLPHRSPSTAAESEALMPNYSTASAPRPLSLSVCWPAETIPGIRSLATDATGFLHRRPYPPRRRSIVERESKVRER
ncbi:hypothetical protein VNO80_04014 [Phaseolus coccineus]|uniref:Uncharacterized protein n=1 Tax=Phaseolus coccineus TaxID=3886 RepID=A0AAN9NSN1_PHACN